MSGEKIGAAVDPAAVRADAEAAGELLERSDSPSCIEGASDSWQQDATTYLCTLRDHCLALAAEVESLRATNTDLHRRTQAAESAAADLLRCSEALASGKAWCGGNMGRAFLAWGYEKAKAERDRLRAEVESLRAERDAAVKRRRPPLAQRGQSDG